MPLKCLNCDCVNPDGVSVCGNCGRNTLYPMKNRNRSKSTGVTGKLTSEVKVPPKVKVSFILMALCVFLIYQVVHTKAYYDRCTATVSGLLDTKYTKVEHSKLFIPYYTHYEVKYAFSVNNQEFKGLDTFSNAPQSIDVQVRYNPNDPTENYVEAQSKLALVGGILLAILFGGLGLVVLFKKFERE